MLRRPALPGPIRHHSIYCRRIKRTWSRQILALSILDRRKWNIKNRWCNNMGKSTPLTHWHNTRSNPHSIGRRAKEKPLEQISYPPQMQKNHTILEHRSKIYRVHISARQVPIWRLVVATKKTTWEFPEARSIWTQQTLNHSNQPIIIHSKQKLEIMKNNHLQILRIKVALLPFRHLTRREAQALVRIRGHRPN